MQIQSIKVSNMLSNSGNKVANQFVIRIKTSGHKAQVAFDEVYFQSYDSVIAKKDWDGNITLDVNDWDYSVTTSKYRNQFTGLTTKETKKKIQDGSIKMEDLN